MYDHTSGPDLVMHSMTYVYTYMDCTILLSFFLLCSALSAGGTRVLNAHSPYPRRSNFRASGVRWKYRRSSTAERLSASGTLTQAEVVEVLVGRTGNSVQFTYEYIVDRPSTHPPSTQPPITTQLPTTIQMPPVTQLPPTTTSTSTNCPGMLHIRILWWCFLPTSQTPFYSRHSHARANWLPSTLSPPL